MDLERVLQRVRQAPLQNTPHPQLRFYERACNLGSLLGCTNLGATLRLGNSAQRPNFVCAAALFARACEGEEPWGCVMLGLAEADGEGMPRDAVAARQRMNKACNEPHASAADTAFACESLAAALDSGKLGPLDHDAATRAYASACRAGSRDACKRGRP